MLPPKNLTVDLTATSSSELFSLDTTYDEELGLPKYQLSTTDDEENYVTKYPIENYKTTSSDAAPIETDHQIQKHGKVAYLNLLLARITIYY